MREFTLNVENYMVVPVDKVKKGSFKPPTLDCFLLDKEDAPASDELRPALIICPGGGYEHISEREGKPVAKRFNSLGFSTFVLTYHIAPFEFPSSLCDLAVAVRMVRKNAAEWGIDPERIAIAGFSAGGHLAASLCIHYKKEWLSSYLDNATPEEIMPNACVLSYPVITSGEFGHQGSFENLLGMQSDADKAKKYKQDLVELVTLDRHVTEDVPPTFLWHTYEDSSVPVENSLLYLSALIEKGVLAEFHMFPFGCHGLALANEETSVGNPDYIQPDCQGWPEMAARFLDKAM